MSIRILLFAELEEKVGTRQIEIDGTEMTAGEVRNTLLEKYPEVSAFNSAMMAINEEYADDQDVVREGDLVAFIPPVSGG
ncbi:molybdopterin converting factor subunit 1 [Salipaludibacillus sp. CUR1]|uniref:molybdopterin converting factor subunit 1 n=1 Tax=Salipaludibacillus sp. CUR1 TaxID=2820003 RepID=UPI001E467A73|nr:molybdopterin converting factor subunit 1 [Salipaludibacillus sp. CUR1]MCE7794901.1 molybdopterin converting factor subunit 1 [Salipaludibacillus sp. CUR1]